MVDKQLHLLLWLTDLVENGCWILFQGCAFFCLHDKAPEFSQDAVFQKAICMCLGLTVQSLCIFCLCWECWGTWSVNGFECANQGLQSPEARSRLPPRAGTNCVGQGRGKAALVWRVGWVQHAGIGAWWERVKVGRQKGQGGLWGQCWGSEVWTRNESWEQSWNRVLWRRRSGSGRVLLSLGEGLPFLCCQQLAGKLVVKCLSWRWSLQTAVKYWISWSGKGVCWYWNLRLVQVAMWGNTGTERPNLSSKSRKQDVYLPKFWMFILPSQ